MHAFSPWQRASLVAALLWAWAPSAAVADQAAGEASFREGLRLLDAGKRTEACEQFRASMSASPSVGALLNVASCSVHENRLAKAQEEYRALLVLNEGTADPQRRKNVDLLAREAMRALLPRVPTMELSIVPMPEVLEVELDGKPLERTRLGTPQPLDPGDHSVKIMAPGFLPMEKTMTVRESDKLVTVLRLVASDPSKRTQPTPDLSVAGWALGGAGIVGLGVGGALLGLSAARASEIEEVCGEGARPPLCDPPDGAARANELSEEGQALQLGGWVSLALGAALTGTGVGLVISSLGPGPELTATWTGPAGAPGWTLVGKF